MLRPLVYVAVVAKVAKRGLVVVSQEFINLLYIHFVFFKNLILSLASQHLQQLLSVNP